MFTRALAINPDFVIEKILHNHSRIQGNQQCERSPK